MDNDNTPREIEEEKTVPVAPLPMAELVRRPRRPLNPLFDCDNGVDDRGGW